MNHVVKSFLRLGGEVLNVVAPAAFNASVVDLANLPSAVMTKCVTSSGRSRYFSNGFN